MAPACHKPISPPRRPSAAAAAPRHEKLNTRAASVVALAVLCSRVLGLVRDQIFGSIFGGGEIMDAFQMAFRIPNLLRDLFAEGALSTAFITVFAKTTATEGDRAAWELANKVATAAAVIVSGLTVIGILCAPWIVAVIAGGFPPEKAALTVTLTRVMFPFILLVSLAALVMGMLNAKNVFGIPATASSFFNLGSIIAGAGIGWLIDPHFGVRATMGLALGTLIGGAMQLGVQLPSLQRLGYRFRPDFHWRDRGVKAILRLMVPSVIAASSTQVNVLVNSMFASHLGNGPVTWLAYSFRLMQLPLGIFGVALGTVSLPLLARMAAGGNIVGFRTELARGMRLAFLLTIPASHRAHPPGAADHVGSVPTRALQRARGLRGGGGIAVLCDRPLRLCRSQGSRPRLLCHRPAQDADVRELRRGRRSISSSTGCSPCGWAGDIRDSRSRPPASRPPTSCCSTC